MQDDAKVAKASPPNLTENEVRRRLTVCSDSNVAKELYDFGRDLLKDATDRVKALEAKAISFGAYGIGVITLLVSSSASWAKPGDIWSLWIATCAGICSLLSTVSCVRVLLLQVHAVISQDEWLQATCLESSDITYLHKYRVLTLWGVIDSYTEKHIEKATSLMKAEVWLTGTAIYLVTFLVHLAVIHTSIDVHWVARWQGVIHRHLWVSGGQWLGCLSRRRDWGWFTALSLGLVLLWWRSRTPCFIRQDHSLNLPKS